MTGSPKRVTLYTDGACSGNPGPGGWAAILGFAGHEKEMSGNMAQTTSNRMELFAVISGLGALKQPCEVDVYSDSAYVVNAFEQHWVQNWLRNGWKNAKKEPVENQDLWKLLLIVMKKHPAVRFHKVPGHADNALNNRCDALARAAIKDLTDYAEQAKAAEPIGF